MPRRADSNTAYLDPAVIRKRLAELRPILASAVVGDFSKKVKIPKKEDELTELFVAIQVMQDVIREQLQELQDLNKSLEQKAAERSGALQEAQALTHLGSWEWDIASGRIAWSDELYRIYGLKPQEREVGIEELVAMIHPDDREFAIQAISMSMKSGSPFQLEYRIVLPDKSERTLFGMGKTVNDKTGKPLRMVGTSQDITERKRNELALQLSDERFRTVSKATHDIVFDMDVRRSRVWVNDVLQTDYGYPPGDPDYDLDWMLTLVHPEDLPWVEKQFFGLLQKGGQTWDAEYRMKKADGTYRTVRNRCFVSRNGAGEPLKVIGSLVDITEAKRLERAKDEFISLVSHQLRTPLTVINLYGNMLTDGIAGPLEPKQQEYVTNISNASIRLIKLVGDILNISRFEMDRIKVQPAPTDVNALVQNRIDELAPSAAAKEATVSFRPQPGLGQVSIDPIIFGEIVHNLVSNAIRYGQDKGGQIKVSFKRGPRGYLLAVADDGRGIAASAQPHILERFYRAPDAGKVDGEGTGLGLYLVKLFVDTAGGKIWFKSTEGKGTTFYVRFPPNGMGVAK